MAIEVFNRYENKYLLSAADYKQVTHILSHHMVLDAYNEGNTYYTISNLYYDTPADELIQASLTKPLYKEKLRLRAYGVPEENGEVYLEIKKKFHGLVNKRRTPLRLKEACRFIQTGEPPAPQPYMNLQVVKEITAFLRRYSLSPKVYIAYDRLAYFAQNNNDLRISFDTNIRTRRTRLALEAGDYGDPLIPEKMFLMEIKTAQTMPLWLTHMLSEHSIYKQSFSKYGTEYHNYVKTKSPERYTACRYLPADDLRGVYQDCPALARL